jgi:hypothetical protein
MENYLSKNNFITTKPQSIGGRVKVCSFLT